jgi:hypothetical protein
MHQQLLELVAEIVADAFPERREAVRRALADADARRVIMDLWGEEPREDTGGR